MPQHKMAVLCFLPDTGHVLPLLRLARVLCRQAPAEVVCYVHSRFEKAVREHGFEHRGLPCVDSLPRSAAFSELSRRSVFYNAFSNYCDLRDHYWAPLRDAASRDLSGLVESLETLRPELILCDSHLFLDFYRRLAAGCGARLITNRAEGSLSKFRRTFTQIYGLRERRRWLQVSVEAAGWIAKQLHKARRLIFQPARRSRTRAMLTAAEERAAVAFADCPAGAADPIHVIAGLAVLEPDCDVISREIAARGEVVLPPTVEVADRNLPADLEDWLASRDDGRVVYVCFGTMAALSEKFLDEMAGGLLDSGAPAIWSLPRAYHGLLARHELGGRLHVEEFVPQVAVLASGKVGCFVTHAGAGSAQDAVIAGKPVLCIPFMWDQPYNSSLLEGLGVGRVLASRRAKRTLIAREIRELLDDPIYRQTASRLAGQVRDLQNGSKDLERILEAASERSA